MAETVSSYISKYSGDQLDAAIAALGSLQELFASKADFDEFVNKFTNKMNEFITAANNSASKAEAATSTAVAQINESKGRLEASNQTLNSTNETLQQMIGGMKFYYVKLDASGNEIK